MCDFDGALAHDASGPRVLALAGRSDCASAAANLAPGHFVMTQRDGAGIVTTAGFVARPRDTPHVRQDAGCVVADDCRFFFRDRQGRTCAEPEAAP